MKKIISYLCYKNKVNYQLGGNIKTIKMFYENEIPLEFKMIYTNNNNLEIYISNETSEERLLPNNSCLSLQIDKKLKIAHLEGISTDTLECFGNADFILRSPGSFYLNMTIKMLKKYKEKLNINKIILLDNAMVKPKYGKMYSLSQFKLLTENKTWYESFGFKITSEYKLQHENNKTILRKVLLSEIKLADLIFECFHKKLNNDYQKEIYKFIIKNENNKLISIMNLIFKENRNDQSDLLYSLIIDDLLRRIERLYDKEKNKEFYYERLKNKSYYLRI